MSGRPPQLSPARLLAGIALPWIAYLVIRSVIGSSVAALAITDAVPSTWLLAVGIARRRVDPIAVLSAATVLLALLAYALTGGNPVAIKLRRGAVTGTVGVAAFASVALGRPLFLLTVEALSKANPDVSRKLADPARRRTITVLTMLVGATFAIDGGSQIALALTVPTNMFVADSTAARIAVLGAGFVVTVQYLRNQKKQIDRGSGAARGSGRTN